MSWTRKLLRGIVPLPIRQLVHSALSSPEGDARRKYLTDSRLGADSPNPWIRKSAEIEGWLFPGEHEFLWELATRGQKGDILEIGTWMGKSACILAGACAASSPPTKLICIDTFEMAGTPSQTDYHKVLVGEVPGTFYRFLENARRLEFLPHVVPIAAPSVAALGILSQPLRMAFVDGTHDFQNVSTDVELCLDKLAVGGIIALHDAVGPGWPDVIRFVEERLQPSSLLRRIGEANTIVAFEKIAPGTIPARS